MHQSELKILRGHYLNVLVTNLVSRGRSELGEPEVEEIFQKLVVDDEVGGNADSFPVLISAATDSIGHRLVVEIFRWIKHFPVEAREKLQKVYEKFRLKLKSDKFGCLIVMSKFGKMPL